MRCLLVLSALVLALVSARPEGYSYFTPHGGSSSGHGGGSATSSASLSFGGDAASLSSGSSEVEDCEEPSHAQLRPYEHQQVHFFAPQVATGHSEASSSSSSSSSSSGSTSTSSLYLGAAAGHEYHRHSQPTVHVHQTASGSGSGSSGLYHYETQPKVVTQQAHHHVEPQVEYFTDVHQQHQTVEHHSHHEPATVHYVQQPVVKEEVHKHVYVHVAPEEKEEIHQKVILPTYTKQKHYKIIFIKAPSPPAASKVVLPKQPVNEEKTLVYVLHKQPELEQEIVVPAPATSKPTKPEVYFIKYKTKKEEQQHHHHHHHQAYHHEESQASSGSYGGSSTVSSLSGSGGFEVADLGSGYGGGSYSTSFAPIVVTEGAYHRYSTTPAPVKVTTVHSVLSSSAAPSVHHAGRSKQAQAIKVSSVGLSGYSAGGSRQRGTKKPCSSKCSKASSAPLAVSDSQLDAFVSNVF